MLVHITCMAQSKSLSFTSQYLQDINFRRNKTVDVEVVASLDCLSAAHKLTTRRHLVFLECGGVALSKIGIKNNLG